MSGGFGGYRACPPAFRNARSAPINAFMKRNVWGRGLVHFRRRSKRDAPPDTWITTYRSLGASANLTSTEDSPSSSRFGLGLLFALFLPRARRTSFRKVRFTMGTDLSFVLKRFWSPKKRKKGALTSRARTLSPSSVPDLGRSEAPPTRLAVTRGTGPAPRRFVTQGKKSPPLTTYSGFERGS